MMRFPMKSLVRRITPLGVFVVTFCILLNIYYRHVIQATEKSDWLSYIDHIASAHEGHGKVLADESLNTNMTLHRAKGECTLISTHEWSHDPVEAVKRKGIHYAGHEIRPVGYRQCQRDIVHTTALLDHLYFIIPNGDEETVPDFERMKNYDDFIINTDAFGFEGEKLALLEFQARGSGFWMALSRVDVLIDWHYLYEIVASLTDSHLHIDILGLNEWGVETSYPGIATIWSSQAVASAVSVLQNPSHQPSSMRALLGLVLAESPQLRFHSAEGTAMGPFVDPDELCHLSVNMDPWYRKVLDFKYTWDERSRIVWNGLGETFQEPVSYLYSRHQVNNLVPEWLILPRSHKGSPEGTYLVHSHPDGVSRRTMLRKHYDWQGLKGKYAFVLGRPSAANFATLEAEARQFDDLVVADFDDNYLHIMIKFFTLTSYYAEFCQKSDSNPDGSDLLIKLDHDVLFWWRGQFALNHGVPDTNISSPVNCLVQMYHDNEPVRCSACSYGITRRQWPFQSYPDYCVGPQFSLNNAAVDQLLYRMKTVEWGQSPWIPTVGQTCMDDVIATGILRAMDNIRIGWGAFYGKHLNKYTDEEFEFAMLEFHQEIETDPPITYEYGH